MHTSETWALKKVYKKKVDVAVRAFMGGLSSTLMKNLHKLLKTELGHEKSPRHPLEGHPLRIRHKQA